MSSPKRRRLDGADERCTRCAARKHLYLALDDWRGGYSLHKLDPDDLPDRLAEPPAVRVTGPDWGTMAFAAFGAHVLIAVNRPYYMGPTSSGEYSRAPPTLIYSTENGALTFGPRLPDDHHCDLEKAVAAGGKLYAVSASVSSSPTPQFSNHWQVLAATGDEDLWDPSFRWSWSSWWSSETAPPFEDATTVCRALHPDGRTIFMSSAESKRTVSVDASNCEWKELGDWVLPFTGQAYYDGEFDAWVGLHADKDGRRVLCMCRVASRSAAAQRPPECTVLQEELCEKYNSYNTPKHGGSSPIRRTKATAALTYIGDSRYCLVETIPCNGNNYRHGHVVHVTLFGLKYGSKGELRTKDHRTTRSYAVYKDHYKFSPAIFYI